MHPAIDCSEHRQTWCHRAFLRNTADQHGMTLVELMVAVSILALVMTGLALSIGVDYKAVALSRSRQVAEAAANTRLEELRDVDYASMALSSAPIHDIDPERVKGLETIGLFTLT